MRFWQRYLPVTDNVKVIQHWRYSSGAFSGDTLILCE